MEGIFKTVLPYLVQTIAVLVSGFIVFRERLIKIEGRLTNQEKATRALEEKTHSDFEKLDKKLDNLIATMVVVKEDVSSINGYLERRAKRTVRKS